MHLQVMAGSALTSNPGCRAEGSTASSGLTADWQATAAASFLYPQPPSYEIHRDPLETGRSRTRSCRAVVFISSPTCDPVLLSTRLGRGYRSLSSWRAGTIEEGLGEVVVVDGPPEGSGPSTGLRLNRCIRLMCWSRSVC